MGRKTAPNISLKDAGATAKTIAFQDLWGVAPFAPLMRGKFTQGILTKKKTGVLRTES